MKSQKYTCSKCGIAVIMREGQAIRPCNHKDAGVIAHMSAVAYGISSLNQKTK